jgi:hypothetical protein
MGVEEVEVIVSADGEVTIQVRGVDGMACLTAADELERVLGGDVLHREMTDEAYQRRVVDEQRNWNRESW